MKTSDFNYDLPPERIAQVPVEPRHASRLLVMNRADQRLTHTEFWNIADYLKSGDVLVVNQTRVIPGRLHARKATGGRVELLLLRQIEPGVWEALVGGKKMSVGTKVVVENGPDVTIDQVLEGSRRVVRFSEPIEPFLPNAGEMPLPPYIHERLADPERYQTVYSKVTGSAAAPTAGLHFTPELMSRLTQMGVEFAFVTLHVGLDTFAPVTEENAEEHIIHTEWCEVTPETTAVINLAKQEHRRVIAVGTTSVRTLESAARLAHPGQVIGEMSGSTDLFILPGYQFKVVDAMVTNFHLPKSSLLMLVSAFAGRDFVLSTYQEAVRLEYRFYSFGDAMLIL
jgi:S-adenosylmethionine:tRNA ribosyltransferase-isomerase